MSNYAIFNKIGVLISLRKLKQLCMRVCAISLKNDKFMLYLVYYTTTPKNDDDCTCE